MRHSRSSLSALCIRGLEGNNALVNSQCTPGGARRQPIATPVGGSYDKDANGRAHGHCSRGGCHYSYYRAAHGSGWGMKALRYAAIKMKRMAEQGITDYDMSLMPMPGCDFIRDDVYDKLQAAASWASEPICPHAVG